MNRTITIALGFLGTVVALAPAMAQDRDVRVLGRVVDAAGKPVMGAEVATFWDVSMNDGKETGLGSAKTDADGKFAVKVDFYGRDAALMALVAEKKLAGLVTIAAKAAKEPVEIRLAPAVRVHGSFDSKELGHKPAWMNIYANLMPGKIRLLQHATRDGAFSMLLPEGEYDLNCYGGDVKGVNKVVKARADQPDIDLGTIDLAATVVAKHRGKTPPPWTLADARGVPKTVTLDDYKGKWVLVDFWGYWCGPCVQQLAEMIDFYEDHAADRDKFEIIAFHDGTVKDFAEMDAKTDRTRKSLWSGRELPFPIVLDAPKGDHGETVARYEIHAFPTSLLIDPEGKLVGEVALQTLEEKLPKIPLARRIPRALDRMVSLGMSGGPIEQSVKGLGEVAHVPVKIDQDALKAAGIDPKTPVPLEMAGAVSLRSWFELLLDPLGLVAVPGEDAILITRPKEGGAPREPTKAQALCNAAIEEKLKTQKTSFDFKDVTLSQLAAHFEGETQENFVLDPADRRSGAIDPDKVVSGSVKDMPIREAVESVLKPLGLSLVVRDEVVLIRKAR